MEAAGRKTENGRRARVVRDQGREQQRLADVQYKRRVQSAEGDKGTRNWLKNITSSLFYTDRPTQLRPIVQRKMTDENSELLKDIQMREQDIDAVKKQLGN